MENKNQNDINATDGVGLTKTQPSSHERFLNLPMDIREEFSKILHSIPCEWNLDTEAGRKIADMTQTFVIDAVNKYTLENN
jgi:hypothetical protein